MTQPKQFVTGMFLCALAISACQEEPGPTGIAFSARLQAAERTEFQGLVYGCSGTGPLEEMITGGGILHFTDATNENLWVTDHPLVNGIERNVVDAHINLGKDAGVANLVATITPPGIDGAWEANLTVKVPGGAKGVGRGKGDLTGKLIRFTIRPTAPGTPNLCNPAHPFVAEIRGTLTESASE